MTLGTFTLGSLVTTGVLPPGSTCHQFTVTATGLTNAMGIIADTKPIGPPLGLVLLFSGTNGTNFWSFEGNGTLAQPFLQSLLNQGYEIVQIKWAGNGWTAAAPNVQSGQEALAVRPATVIQWVKDHWAQGKFCLTGNSGGSAQITYAISSYPVSADVVVPSSGPPFAAITKGCLNTPGYGYDISKCQLVDQSFGFPSRLPGPCALHDPAFTAQWDANSVETGGTLYNYPNTKVHMILGGQDTPMILAHADDYYRVLVAAGQVDLAWQVVPTMAHGIQISADGLAALSTALTT